MKKGIDVSYAQGRINWDKVAKAGLDFVIIRAGYGVSTVDDQFVRNVQECKRLKIPVGVYWFSYAKTVEQAKQEAEKCLATIRPYKVDMFVAWDWENDSYTKAVTAGVKPTATLVSAMAEAFLSTVRAAGYEAVNYSNIDYLKRFFSSEIKEKYPTWVAQWPSAVAFIWPQTATVRTQYTGKHIMWQFGCFTGIPGLKAVDADIYYGEEDNMTPEEIYDAYNAAAAMKPCPEWAKKELQEAIDMGITDGSRPMQLIPRYQAAIMAKRAAQKK